MTAVGDYVYKEAPPPPILSRAFDYKSWSIDVRDLPAGEIRGVTAAWNIYRAIAGYRQAATKHKTAEWSKQYEAEFEIVTRYLAERIKRKHGTR